MKNILALLGISASAILLCFFIVIFFFPSFSLGLADPKIIKELPKNGKKARREFKSRVSNLFPNGTSNDEITDVLINQGFTVKTNNAGKQFAFYTRHMIVCRYNWLISWEADGVGNISDLSAEYRDTCL